MKTEVMSVSPALAKMWLQLNVGNRRLNEIRVNGYAKDMQAGNWKLTHQGIAISEDNVVTDGQHRLEAIVKSGCTVPLLVTTGLPRDSVIAVDRGFNRTVVDALHLSIADSAWIGPRVVSALKWFFDFSGNSASAAETYEAALSHKGSFLFAVGEFPTTRVGLTRAPVLAAIALLHANGADPDTLSDFCSKLMSGVVEGDGESSIIRLRDQLLSDKFSGYTGSVSAMNRVQKAYVLFATKTPCKCLRESEDMIYPRMKFKYVVKGK